MKSPIGEGDAVGETLRMNWRSIRLELGKTRDFPAGSVSRAFLIRLPLDDCDAIDAAALQNSPSRASVRRHWSSDPDQCGVLTPSGGDWAMRCDSWERLFRLNGTPMRLGQQVDVVEPDGTILPFKVASVR